MTPWLVTTNVGAGPGGSAARTAGMAAWATSVLERGPALVCAQEVPATDWLNVWTDAGYRPWCGPDRGWKVRSALLTRPDLEFTAIDFPNRTYHGSYVAAARVTTRRGPVTVASVQASPNQAEPEKYGWSGPVPSRRDGGDDPRYVGRRLWDSDLLLSTLAGLAASGPLLAAGDLNEAEAHDLDPRSDHHGTWGKEYFERLSTGGLTDHLSQSWRGERPTRGRLQLDRLIVNSSGRSYVSDDQPEIDKAWAAPAAAARLSDHAAIWVRLTDDWSL